MTEERDLRGSNAASRTPRQSLAAYLKTPAWATAPTAPDRDVVLVSRARLARNLANSPFPGRADDGELRSVGHEIRRAALADTERLADLSPVWIAALTPEDRAALVDARRISPDLASAGPHAYALLNEAGMLSIFINEEDHLRIQALSAGNTLMAALDAAEDADGRLGRRLRYAHSERWGHMTTALSNLGTGLRLSVLAHLPALEFLNRLPKILDAAQRLDISVRGAHGERSAAVGSLYQISNAFTWSRSTRLISAPLGAFVEHLVTQERTARADLAEQYRKVVERAYDAASERIAVAERLEAEEALALLSIMRLGAITEIGPAPGPDLFAVLVADLRTAASLSGIARFGLETAVVRQAIQRPARLRSALRSAIPNPHPSSPASGRGG